MKKRNATIVAVLALGVAGAGWWLERATRPDATPSPALAVVKPHAESTATTPINITAQESARLANKNDVAEQSATASSQSETGASSPSQPTVADILAEPGDDYVKIAQKLAVIVADDKTAMKDREEALAHTLNLSAGNENEVLLPLIKNPNLPDELTSTILDEALNRSLAYQADLYLAALVNHKSEAIQTKVREHLAFLTGGTDLGADPAPWSKAIETARKDWAE